MRWYGITAWPIQGREMALNACFLSLLTIFSDCQYVRPMLNVLLKQ